MREDSRLLEATGLGATEERIYLALLERPGSTPVSLARESGATQGQVGQALRSLENKGLATRSPGRRARFHAAPPEVALEALILARQEALERSRLTARALEEQFRRSGRRTAAQDLVDVVASHAAVVQRVNQLNRGAERELLELSKPPYAVPPGRQTTLRQALRRGVRCRVIFDQEAIEQPGALEELPKLERAGAEIRMYREVPMKLLIADGRMGLLPLHLEEPGVVEGALFLHQSSLLEALARLFETVWKRAVPVGSLSGRRHSEDQDLLIKLLLSGLKTRAIARRLALGVSTVERRIKHLMQDLDAHSRFQAGFLLASRGSGQERGGAENPSANESESSGDETERSG